MGTEGNTVKNRRVISNYRFPATMKGKHVDITKDHPGTVIRKTHKGWFVLFEKCKYEVEVFKGEITFV